MDARGKEKKKYHIKHDTRKTNSKSTNSVVYTRGSLNSLMDMERIVTTQPQNRPTWIAFKFQQESDTYTNRDELLVNHE